MRGTRAIEFSVTAASKRSGTGAPRYRPPRRWQRTVFHSSTGTSLELRMPLSLSIAHSSLPVLESNARSRLSPVAAMNTNPPAVWCPTEIYWIFMSRDRTEVNERKKHRLDISKFNNYSHQYSHADKHTSPRTITEGGRQESSIPANQP